MDHERLVEQSSERGAATAKSTTSCGRIANRVIKMALTV